MINLKLIRNFVLTFTRRCRTSPKPISPARSLGRPLCIMSFGAHVFYDRRHFKCVRTRDRAVDLDVRTTTSRWCYTVE